MVAGLATAATLVVMVFLVKGTLVVRVRLVLKLVVAAVALAALAQQVPEQLVEMVAQHQQTTTQEHLSVIQAAVVVEELSQVEQVERTQATAELAALVLQELLIVVVAAAAVKQDPLVVQGA